MNVRDPGTSRWLSKQATGGCKAECPASGAVAVNVKQGWEFRGLPQLRGPKRRCQLLASDFLPPRIRACANPHLLGPRDLAILPHHMSGSTTVLAQTAPSSHKFLPWSICLTGGFQAPPRRPGLFYGSAQSSPTAFSLRCFTEGRARSMLRSFVMCLTIWSPVPSVYEGEGV